MRYRTPLKYRLKGLLVTLLIILLIFGCVALSFLTVKGGWQLLVSTITSLMAQGPAAIISAIVAVLFSYYCLIPLAIFVIFILLIIFVYRN